MYSHKKRAGQTMGARTDPGRTLNRRDVAEGPPLYDVHREGEGSKNRMESKGVLGVHFEDVVYTEAPLEGSNGRCERA